MKKLLLFLVFAGFLACENEMNQELPQDASVTEGINARENDKIDVCHYDAENDSWHMINISINAWEGHEKHGDVMLIDADGDGWVSFENECVLGGDCDDENAEVNPGVVEVCNGIDDNCNDEVDEGCIPFVTICEQDWMDKNLDVSTFRNGDPIPLVEDAATWASLTTGAYCYFNNDPANGAIYGKLYNWYAVNDPRGLAPKGWHVPTDAEWTTLIDCLGGTEVAGGKMKEIGTAHWNSPNIGATNSSGFTALPGNFRNIDGTYHGAGSGTDLWSSTEDGTTKAWGRALVNYDDSATSDNNSKEMGFSVRCLRD